MIRLRPVGQLSVGQVAEILHDQNVQIVDMAWHLRHPAPVGVAGAGAAEAEFCA